MLYLLFEQPLDPKIKQNKRKNEKECSCKKHIYIRMYGNYLMLVMLILSNQESVEEKIGSFKRKLHNFPHLKIGHFMNLVLLNQDTKFFFILK